ncbi:flagellin (plasmid) [Novosphingobium sp. BL-8H]|uniref:flagellin N-terminal helical domain-containing protein n=1 Tax=Novosphingobium sp. BL-8H TaxID=3127640 RepID=UPI0037577D1F
MSSIKTNASALAALRVLESIRSDLEIRQSRLATGLRVKSTKDDSAAFVRAQNMRGDLLLQKSLGDTLDRWSSITDVAISGGEAVSDLMNTLQEKSLLLIGAVNDPASAKAIRADMEGLIAQIGSTVDSSEFAGVNLLKGRPATRTTSQTYYSLPTSTVSPSKLLAWLDYNHNGAAMPEDSLEAGMSGTRRLTLPDSALTPQSFTDLINPADSIYGPDVRYIADNAAYTYTVDGGSTAGRVNLLIDTGITNFADSYGTAQVEIWQGGVRVAASGQAYAADGAEVGPSSAEAGPFVLSFDYDPAPAPDPDPVTGLVPISGNGQEIEIRILGGSRGAGIEGLQLQDPAEPIPTPSERWDSEIVYETHAVTENAAGSLNPEEVSALRDDPLGERALPIGVQANYEVDAGPDAAHVDLTFDAYDLPDTMEIWQNGVRIAATGQTYASGGAPVDAGVPVSGLNVLSFDYDPALGPLTISVNGSTYDPASAWAIGAVSMREIGATPYTAVDASSRTKALYTSAYATTPYDFTDDLKGGTTRIYSRDLSPGGLGLDTLDWTDPEAVAEVISGANKKVLSALSYFGAHSRNIAGMKAASLSRTDVMTEALGHLVDADMSKEAAKLQALQVREQLAVKALAIANQAPSILLTLFQT